MLDEPTFTHVERRHAFDLHGRRRRRQASEGIHPEDARHLPDRLKLRVGQVRKLTSIHGGQLLLATEDSGNQSTLVGAGLTTTATKCDGGHTALNTEEGLEYTNS
ncbi:hypothetical protein P3T76_001854 [Phytophthora citrophthora]|uniref:Uncharacterized protein n=1 Tax=Phytophthora citrophthora TaxID=4793 RepID=A0AAD9GXA5_9STRA|nr:hypothetical protein P3T76_001854 [Phytophthora citrophthora]